MSHLKSMVFPDHTSLAYACSLLKGAWFPQQHKHSEVVKSEGTNRKDAINKLEDSLTSLPQFRREHIEFLLKLPKSTP